jgi:hypothetical protein
LRCIGRNNEGCSISSALAQLPIVIAWFFGFLLGYLKGKPRRKPPDAGAKVVLPKPKKFLFCFSAQGAARASAPKGWTASQRNPDFFFSARAGTRTLSAVVGDRERQRRLVIVGRAQAMDATMARRTDRQEIPRKLVEDPDVSQMVDFGRGVLEATLADVFGAFERAATFLGPKFRAEIPLVGSRAV